jgi:hypothetical protein
MTFKQPKLPKLTYIPIELKSGSTVLVANPDRGIVVYDPSKNETVFAPLEELVEYIMTAPVEEPEVKPDSSKLRVVKNPPK